MGALSRPLSQAPASLVVVWDDGPWLVHFTVLATLTVMLAGENLKSSIVMLVTEAFAPLVVPPPPGCWTIGPVVLPPQDVTSARSNAVLTLRSDRMANLPA
jgi:hypothetical protein